VQLLSRHEALALLGAVVALTGLALAVTGTGSPMFVRRTTVTGNGPTADGLDGRFPPATSVDVIFYVTAVFTAEATHP